MTHLFVTYVTVTNEPTILVGVEYIKYKKNQIINVSGGKRRARISFNGRQTFTYSSRRTVSVILMIERKKFMRI